MRYDRMQKMLKMTSFIEEEDSEEEKKDQVTKQPDVYKWTPPNPGFKFNGKDTIIKTEG